MSVVSSGGRSMIDGSPRIAVIGHGVVGRRVAKHLGRRRDMRAAGTGVIGDVVLVDSRRDLLASSPRLDGVGIAVLAHPGPHRDEAIVLLDRGISVVSVGDGVDDVRALCAEAERAETNGVSLVVGAGMSPGLSILIARLLIDKLATADEVRVAIHGTAGPACARQHHHALAGASPLVDDGRPVFALAGTGRDLVWFPEPVGAYDCYYAEVPSPMVMHAVFPQLTRISTRMSATRRDRFTSRLPMLTPPHVEGGVGALRVEVRGADADGARVTLIAGIAEMVGTATAATAASYARMIAAGGLVPGLTLPGAAGVDTVELLRWIEHFGVRLQEFTGVPSA